MQNSREHMKIALQRRFNMAGQWRGNTCPPRQYTLHVSYVSKLCNFRAAIQVIIEEGKYGSRDGHVAETKVNQSQQLVNYILTRCVTSI